MDTKKLQEVLDLHSRWVRGESGGGRADLSRANLFGAGLSGADLYRADLSGANLSRAGLSGADLSRAGLSGADLSGANLPRANLSRANLSGANLSGADLSEANLSGADLSEANLSEANLSGADLFGANLSGSINFYPEQWQIVPQTGSFFTWKAVRGYILLLQIPENAGRTNCIGSRKLRVERARVIAAYKPGSSRKSRNSRSMYGMYDCTFKYRVGALISSDSYNPSSTIECTNGIHCFLTRVEAESWLVNN